MKWIYATYKGAKDIKPSFCHPLYHKTRAAYIFERYGARVEYVERVTDLHFDLGGMIRTDDPCVEIKLGTVRGFSCWAHVHGVLSGIEQAKAIEHKRCRFWKFARWPGVICFISNADRVKIVARLKLVLDPSAEARHAEEMRDGLVDANVAATGLPRDVVREAMDGHAGELN